MTLNNLKCASDDELIWKRYVSNFSLFTSVNRNVFTIATIIYDKEKDEMLASFATTSMLFGTIYKNIMGRYISIFSGQIVHEPKI